MTGPGLPGGFPALNISGGNSNINPRGSSPDTMQSIVQLSAGLARRNVDSGGQEGTLKISNEYLDFAQPGVGQPQLNSRYVSIISALSSPV